MDKKYHIVKIDFDFLTRNTRKQLINTAVANIMARYTENIAKYTAQIGENSLEYFCQFACYQMNCAFEAGLNPDELHEIVLKIKHNEVVSKQFSDRLFEIVNGKVYNVNMRSIDEYAAKYIRRQRHEKTPY